jgi:hypothetical protein
MKSSLIRAGILTLAGSVGAGMMAIGGTASADTDTALLSKREDSSSEWLVADDDNDDDRDDTNTRTGGQSNTRSNVSGVETRTRGAGTRTNDMTGSRHSRVSRDRDHSRGDQTRDWTRDGGDRTRDFSRNLTNDRSRNDTR